MTLGAAASKPLSIDEGDTGIHQHLGFSTEHNVQYWVNKVFHRLVKEQALQTPGQNVKSKEITFLIGKTHK